MDFQHLHPNDKNIGQTGPFWIGSGMSLYDCSYRQVPCSFQSCAALAIFSAVITYFFIRPLSHDGMAEEDRKFREYLEQNGYDTSQMGLPGTDTETSSRDYDEKKDHMVSTATV